VIPPTPWWLRLIFWECERGSLIYDLLCAGIVLALVLIRIPLPGRPPPSEILGALERVPEITRSEVAGDQIFYLHLTQPAAATDRAALRRLRAALLGALPPPPGRISYDLDADGQIVGVWLDLRDM
jgi:hypothetical protein